MGRKCSVESCLSESTRREDTGVTFHKVPYHVDIRPKWFSLCRIPEEKKSVKVIYICSRHFLRADFCNWKGKKFMLRQGVLPSVFPWDKSKLEAIKKDETKTEETKIKIEPKEEPETSQQSEPEEPKIEAPTPEKVEEDVKPNLEELEKAVKLEPASESKETVAETMVKEEPKEPDIKTENPRPQSTSGINFAINEKIEALDFNSQWFPAKIVEVDYEEKEVLIHFDKFSSKYDEWICMDSPRLRAPQLPPSGPGGERFAPGERCLAAWSDSRKFPATITKVLENDTFEVQFDDGFIKVVKGHRIGKAQGKPQQSSPLFEPIQSSKQERRDKKRKLNVAALFSKKAKLAAAASAASTLEDKKPPPTTPTAVEKPDMPEEEFVWSPQAAIRWENGKPVGTDSVIETNDGPRASIIVADPRLPDGWVKHLMQRIHGTSAGKWDTIIVGPDGKRFRTKSEVKAYLENHPELDAHETMFDFSLHRTRPKRPAERRQPVAVAPPPPVPPVVVPEAEDPQESGERTPENANALKIVFVDNAYKCPIDGCGKNFRKENLAQMHVKHYHKEFTKFLDSTPNVADLAYARTVGENFEKSPSAAKMAQMRGRPASKPVMKPSSPMEMPEDPKKDSEIIRLLSGSVAEKPVAEQQAELLPATPLQSPVYPEVKLRDLLSASESPPKRDDAAIKTMCAARPPVGIKTLLPVVRSAAAAEATPSSSSASPPDAGKRKRDPSESQDVGKGNNHLAPFSSPTSPHADPPPQQPPPPPPPSQPPPPPPPQPDIIIEGGKIIKIVRMKQEEIINCTCRYTEEDGLMIQCELCLCWQHAYCNNIERESQVPDKYVCYICQNPLRERASRHYYHDQDWLKQGNLPTASFHSADEEALQRRAEQMKRLSELSGALVELRDFHHTLAVKLKIAENKNHPKLYLWSKDWDKQPLPEKAAIKPEPKEEEPKPEGGGESMLMMILKDNSAPIIPKAEATIESADCRLKLLDHIAHCESLIEERLDDFEKIIESMEEGMDMEADPNYPRTRQTLQMLTKDLDVLREFSELSTI